MCVGVCASETNWRWIACLIPTLIQMTSNNLLSRVHSQVSTTGIVFHLQYEIHILYCKRQKLLWRLGTRSGALSSSLLTYKNPADKENFAASNKIWIHHHWLSRPMHLPTELLKQHSRWGSHLKSYLNFKPWYQGRNNLVCANSNTHQHPPPPDSLLALVFLPALCSLFLNYLPLYPPSPPSPLLHPLSSPVRKVLPLWRQHSQETPGDSCLHQGQAQFLWILHHQYW